MKVYQVGGSVRDELMGLMPRDRDYVVVGSSVAEMLALGYEQVGKSFPVFLHPQTREEYALARREKKVGTGYHGFEMETKGVALEEDLYRRDLTINAMAKDEHGVVFDPFDGQKDLADKILRHVSDHFAEDPLRVLRVARFQARYIDFSVAQETKKLMKQLVKAELHHLSSERYEKEFTKILSEAAPYKALALLAEVGFFESYLPEWKFSEKMSLVDQPGSVYARLLALVQDQESPDAFKVLKGKLGFKSAELSEGQQIYSMLKKTPFNAEYVVNLMMKTKAHQRVDSYALAKEVLTLRKESLVLHDEVLKVAEVFKATDFSFVTELPNQARTAAVKEKMLSLYQYLED